MRLTDEQLKILKEVKNGTPLIKVVAFAGTGKTTLLYNIAKEIKGRKLYLAFNKAIQLEAKEKFQDTNTLVKTTHSLAYNFVVRKYGYQLKRNYSTIEISNLYSVDYETAYKAKVIFESFCNSASRGFSDDEDMKDEKYIAKNMFEDMLNKNIDITHSFYLKKFQLDLLDNKIQIYPYDIVLLDEAQDTNDVTLSIFYTIPARQKIIVGDRHQQIYSFRGSVNAISKIKAKIFFLTNSFRFNQEIANKATNFLEIFRNEKQSLKGLGKETKIKTKAIISRTNSELINQIKILKILGKEKDFKTIREPYEIFGLALNLAKLNDKEELDKDYKFLNSFKMGYKNQKANYDDILDYIFDEAKSDIELQTALKVAKTPNLEELYQLAKENFEKESNLFLSTAHTSKGLEFDEVEVCGDFPCYKTIANFFVEKQITKKPPEGYLEYFVKNCKDQSIIDELNLYYVAITRAKVKVIDKTAFKNLDKEIANLKIEFEISDFKGEKNEKNNVSK